MVPLFVLVVSFVIFEGTRFVGFNYFPNWQRALACALAVMFFVTASAHWGRLRGDLVKMVPPSFPRPEWIVTITGILEVAGVIGLLFQPTASFAAFLLAGMLIAMFPANWHAAKANISLGGRPATPIVIRLPMQVFFIACLIAAGWPRR